MNEFFTPNKKCIVNTDLDGIISGMLLQKYLNWEVIGYSSCCGKEDDNLWLFSDLEDCVFIDLPVCLPEYKVIDQHFVAIDNIQRKNILNPNLIRNKTMRNNQYTQKYPFGTAHFILAVLDSMMNIDIDLFKQHNDFDIADLILRADRVIGNTNQYTQNCFDWANWLISIGGNLTKTLFEEVKNNYLKRKQTELNVERFLQKFKVSKDGDCSNLFKTKDYITLGMYLSTLSCILNMPKLPIEKFKPYNNFIGQRLYLSDYSLDQLKEETEKVGVFSYAFVSTKVMSLTYYNI